MNVASFTPSSVATNNHVPPAAVPDLDRLDALAKLLVGGKFEPFHFDTPPENFPPVGHPRALEFFFAVVMHQFGFWEMTDGVWSRSLYALVDGERLKGSDFVFRSASKSLAEGKSDVTEFLDDSGSCPLPMLEAHRQISAQYRAYAATHPPAAIVAEANASGRPLEHLMEQLTLFPGYAEDPYRKKAMLLAMTLANRPEKWLGRADGGELTGWAPVVDYHIQRTSLRTGIVRVPDDTLRDQLVARRALTADQEDAVRRATFDAIQELSRRSGMSHAAIDFLFFQARRRCPESREEAIDCPQCPLEPACAKLKEMFQPVFRTTAY